MIQKGKFYKSNRGLIVLATSDLHLDKFTFSGVLVEIPKKLNTEFKYTLGDYRNDWLDEVFPTQVTATFK